MDHMKKSTDTKSEITMYNVVNKRIPQVRQSKNLVTF